MPQRADPPKIWVRNELKFLGIDLIVMLHLRSPDILIEEVQLIFLPQYPVVCIGTEKSNEMKIVKRSLSKCDVRSRLLFWRAGCDT